MRVFEALGPANLLLALLVDLLVGSLLLDLLLDLSPDRLHPPLGVDSSGRYPDDLLRSTGRL